MGLFCSKLKTCKKNNHHIRGVTCDKCNKDHDYCMDCDFPEWYNCCMDKPLLYRHMNFPTDRNISLANYIWNIKGYFEIKADALKNNADIIEKNRLRYEKLERDREISRLQIEKLHRQREEESKKAKCSKCGFPIKEIMDKIYAKKYVETSPDQTCTNCFLREHNRKAALYCRRCNCKPTSPGGICYECSITCRKCGKNIDTPEHETITLRGEDCPMCKHNHINKCNSAYEKIIEGTNVFFDTQIGPGRYYNNMVRREEPFRYRKEIPCGCSNPITTIREICIHET